MSWPSVKPPWKHVKWFNWGPHSWTNPPDLQWSEQLSVPDISGDLFKLKQEIEVLDAKNEWEFLKRSSNPYELVFSQSHDSRIPQSICSLRPLSRSFFKMIEILSVMDFFKRHVGSRKHIRSAHVCEGPGGFIEALLHVAGKNSFTVENAWAMTLNPTKVNIPGWKRAFYFLKKSQMVHIEYGADNTGDITVPANQLAFLEKTRGKCHIFTADGGFDFSEHYSTQEEEVIPLLVSSIIIGLQTMVKGGDFILKVFDTELDSTRDILAILAYCFDHWTLYKPSLSRPCNAEKYFLGRGCRVVPSWIIKLLMDIRDSSKRILSIFPGLPPHIEQQITFLKKEYLDQQITALNYAISHKDEWNTNSTAHWNSIQLHSIAWCKQFHMPIKSFVAPMIIDPDQAVALHKNSVDVVQPE